MQHENAKEWREKKNDEVECMKMNTKRIIIIKCSEKANTFSGLKNCSTTDSLSTVFKLCQFLI